MAGITGMPASWAILRAITLLPRLRITSGGGPTNTRPASVQASGKFGILRQKAIARVDRLGPGLFGRFDNLADIQVIFPGAGADAHRLIGPHDMVGVLVGLLVDGHHLEAQLLGGAHDAQGDLPPVGHLYFFESWTDNHGFASAQARPARKGR